MVFKDGTPDGGWGCIGVLVSLVIVVAVTVVIGALGIGAADSWFFGGNFSDGWNAAFAKPLVLLGWTVLFYGIVAAVVFNRD